MFTRGPDAGCTVWDVLCERVPLSCDLANPAAQNCSQLFMAIYHVFRKLRPVHPEWIVDIVLLLLPSAASNIGACAWMPNGLGKVAVPKLNEHDLDSLLETMEGSKVIWAIADDPKKVAP